MKFFIVCALLVAAVAAQDDDAVPPGRTRICKEGEFPGKRNRRQAANPDAPKPCWFIPDASITKGEDCEKKFEETQTCEKSQVFVPLGQIKVCIKFEAAPKWFLSEGTNGYCGVNECCEWYPKETEKVVFCSPKRPLLNWFPLDSGKKCDDVDKKEAAAKVGVEIIKGAAGSETEICLAVGNPEDEGGVKFVEAPAKLSDNCGGGCCIFELVKKDE